MSVISKIKSIILDFRIAHAEYDYKQTRDVFPKQFPPSPMLLQKKKRGLDGLRKQRRSFA